MNSKLLRISLICLGAISFCSAAETISGEVLEDLFFYDSVQISGVVAPINAEAEVGMSSVTLAGTGSVTIGDRSDGGMLRLIVWGGTDISSERIWNESDKKVWWEGELESPTQGRTTTENIEFSVSGNHSDSQVAVLETYALGLENETFHFAPAATLVLPVSVPDLTKVWIAMKRGSTWEKIGEDDFCIVQSQLCVVDTESVNEITLVREKFDHCEEKEISNGSVGQPPYCQIDCDRGFVPNGDLTKCVESDDESAIEIFETDNVDIEGATIKRTGKTGLLSGPARQGYIRYWGSNIQRTPIETGDLSGEELRAALKLNATVSARNSKTKKGSDSSLVAGLEKQLNNIQAKLWTWENPVLPEVAEGEAYSAKGGVAAMEGNDSATHTSAPLLPSTGPAGIFIGVAALGFGLMAFSRRRRR